MIKALNPEDMNKVSGGSVVSDFDFAPMDPTVDDKDTGDRVPNPIIPWLCVVI